MGAVYLLTLRQLSGRWRVLIMSALAALPVLVVSIMVRSDTAPSVAVFERTVLSAILVGSITPLVVLAIASVAFANEIEDRTLANLTLTPLQRWRIALPKLLGAITVAAPFIAASALVTAHTAYLGDTTAMIAVAVSAVVGVALYASLFVWLGLVSTQAIGVGLLYIVLWEGFFSRYVSGVRLLSVRHYAIGWMQALDGRRFAGTEQLSPAVAVATSVLVFSAFFYLTVRRLRRMDVP